MGQSIPPHHAIINRKAAQYKLRMYVHIWNKALQSTAAEVLSECTTENPPDPQLDPLHDRDPDEMILEANQSFLKSLRSLRDTNQSYLNISQQGILPPARDVASKLPPTPRIPQLDPRHLHNNRDGKENSDPKQSPDVNGCADELNSMGLTSS